MVLATRVGVVVTHGVVRAMLVIDVMVLVIISSIGDVRSSSGIVIVHLLHLR